MIDKEKLIDLFTRYEYETLCVKDEEYAIFSSGTSMCPTRCAINLLALLVFLDEGMYFVFYFVYHKMALSIILCKC